MPRIFIAFLAYTFIKTLSGRLRLWVATGNEIIGSTLIHRILKRKKVAKKENYSLAVVVGF